MVLKDLIDYLEKQDLDKIVPMGFANPHSYRGDYEQLAFEPKENIAIGEMLQAAKSALGKTFDGWKGGKFNMGEYTTVNLAEQGCCGEEIGIILLDYMCGNL